MLQKIMNSPIEKENSSKCMDVVMSKALSPSRSSPTFATYNRHVRGRHPLEDHDPNSQDSGFFTAHSDDSRSVSVGDKRTLSDMRSESNTSYTAVLDDAFLDNAVSPARLSQDSLPPGFSTLIDGDIFSQTSPIIKPIVKRKITKYSSDTPRKTDLLFGDIKNNEAVVRKRKLTRDLESTPETNVLLKKTRPSISLSMSFDSPRLDYINSPLTAPVSQGKRTLFDYGFCKKEKPVFRRSFSTSEATIKAAFEKEDTGEKLIGDFSKSFVLPLMPFGRHADLCSISPETLAELLNGAYDDFIDSYLIIDCRYPYEFEGGHIRGAVNIFTKEQLLKNYTEDQLGKRSPKNESNGGKRNLLIFHCEFSSERGPSLSRYLRNADRENNSMCYPYLDYPEMYLLDGGYCKFFSKYRHLCEPSNYRAMLDPAHKKELRLFRSKSKTWAGDGGTSRLVSKNTLKRLGFN
ncbi:M-phase inducer phosphatase-like isoform X3 [Daktulosphaira vitifoliae]|nr:M-phase inducer phosphatase-like isoform X3 [Daktulosphaira vitifoliae]